MKYGRNYGINGIRRLFFIALILSAPVSRNWADTPFPFKDNKKVVLGIGLEEAPIYIKPLDSSKAVLVHDGMTLKELVDDLGPGYSGPNEGVGLIRWYFKNNHTLYVWPKEYKESEVIHMSKAGNGTAFMWWSN